VQGVYAERPEPLLNQCAGTRFSETEFGMRMQIPAPTHHLVVVLFYFVQYRHLQISCLYFYLNAIIRAHKEQFGSIGGQSCWLP
jgi:hypothetical protein